jgi:hypothetical protein
MLALGTFLDVKFYLVHWHHVMVIMTIGLSCLLNLHTSNFIIINLTCEVNNCFMHAGKLMRRFGWAESSRLYKLNNIGFYISFFATRLGPHLFVFQFLIYHRDILDAAWQWNMGFYSMVLLLLVDVSMLFDFIKSRRRSGRGHGASSATSVPETESFVHGAAEAAAGATEFDKSK